MANVGTSSGCIHPKLFAPNAPPPANDTSIQAEVVVPASFHIVFPSNTRSANAFPTLVRCPVTSCVIVIGFNAAFAAVYTMLYPRTRMAKCFRLLLLVGEDDDDDDDDDD
eukprot:CAMPEP_0196201988 /NCGR_PEP_ID=MMETSP0912-20130531/4911_1 /TAXON_ID=49265 /ORGANISM="Thalassiosira rotula, Strain GSO102" /LENGTH=109 /DNA_ID=CAMNT_0041475785 /DNA_START=115 /DNA_END=441 /DNA_ORIENTATION=+